MKLTIIISIVFLAIIFCSLLFFYMRKLKLILKKKKSKKNNEQHILNVDYLTMRHKLDKKRLLSKKIMLLFAIIDSLIITITFFIIMLIPVKYAFKIGIGFILIFILIFVIYEIIGLILKKKGYQNEHK